MISTPKNFLSALLFTLLFTLTGVASPLATFNYKVFFVPEKGPVVETYIDISGRSIMLKPIDDENWKGNIELTLIFKQGDKIVTFDKKLIESPIMTPADRVDFMDIQRFAIPPGKYQLEIQISDVSDEGDVMNSTEIEVFVPKPSADIFISDIELISAYKKTITPGPFSKSGFDLLPMVNDDHLNPNMKEIIFYSEIYNSKTIEGEKFLVKAYLADTISNTPVAATVKYDRRDVAEVCPVILRIPIEEVPTGFYNLVLEAVSKENVVLSRQALGLYRSQPLKEFDMTSVNEAAVAASWVNTITSKPEIFEYLRCLRPIAKDRELVTLDNTFGSLEETNLEYMQQYFYTFWKSRNETESEKEWLMYKEKVKLAEKEYGSRNKRGYETDRGRVFLKYGQPNRISDVANEPTSYPYEIWHYYRADKYNNVKFVFYDPMLMGTDYELLHCEFIPGEVNNPSWKSILRQRTGLIKQGDENSQIDSYGGNIDENFENPR